jgi:selenium metabolism protein YedF
MSERRDTGGATEPGERVAMLVVSEAIGPEPELGRVLMRAFLGTLVKAASRPSRLLFVNRGVHLTTEGSEVAGVLAELEASGVELLSCGTCLDYFGKRDRLLVGRVSNMYETVETLTGPAKVVTIG